jgi:hypothetical protein
VRKTLKSPQPVYELIAVGRDARSVREYLGFERSQHWGRDGVMRCSCGCGRAIGLGQLRDDRRARTARRLTEEMEARGFADDADEYRRAFLFEGVSWRNQYTRVVHGELARDDIRGDAAWADWKSGARAALREARRA